LKVWCRHVKRTGAHTRRSRNATQFISCVVRLHSEGLNGNCATKTIFLITSHSVKRSRRRPREAPPRAVPRVPLRPRAAAAHPTALDSAVLTTFFVKKRLVGDRSGPEGPDPGARCLASSLKMKWRSLASELLDLSGHPDLSRLWVFPTRPSTR